MPLPRLERMTLMVTERCNQRCSYCHLPVGDGRKMERATAHAAVDLLFDEGPRLGSRSLLFFGGEPFLATDTIEDAAGHAARRRRFGQRLRLAAQTNATALDDAALGAIARHHIEIGVSLDGAGRERRFADGRPAEEAARLAIPRLRVVGAQPFARMTVTPLRPVTSNAKFGRMRCERL